MLELYNTHVVHRLNETIYVFMDDSTSDGYTSWFARTFFGRELREAHTQLFYGQANLWHTTKGNFGMFNYNRGLALRNGLRVIEATTLPSFYLITPHSIAKSDRALSYWKGPKRPKRRDFSDGMLPTEIFYPNAQGSTLINFVAHVLISLEEWLKLQGQGVNRDVIVVCDDCGGAITHAYREYVRQGGDVVRFASDSSLGLHLRRVPKDDRDADYFLPFLALADSEVWALNQLRKLTCKPHGTKLDHYFLNGMEDQRCDCNIETLWRDLRHRCLPYWNLWMRDVRLGRSFDAMWGVRKRSAEQVASGDTKNHAAAPGM